MKVVPIPPSWYQDGVPLPGSLAGAANPCIGDHTVATKDGQLWHPLNDHLPEAERGPRFFFACPACQEGGGKRKERLATLVPQPCPFLDTLLSISPQTALLLSLIDLSLQFKEHVTNGEAGGYSQGRVMGHSMFPGALVEWSFGLRLRTRLRCVGAAREAVCPSPHTCPS